MESSQSRDHEFSRMSNTISKFDTVNNSTAKQKFSFGKEARFPSVTKKIHNQSIGYDLPSTLKKRGCSFGVGTRFKTPDQLRQRSSKLSLFVSNISVDSPPPNSYNLKSEFDVGHPGGSTSNTKAGLYTFGIGRQAYAKVYLP